MRKMGVTVVTAALIVSAAAAGCDRGEPGRAPTPGAVDSVAVSPAVSGPGIIRAPATVRSTDEVEVATRGSGTLERVNVQVGSRVRKGDTLALVDPEAPRARIEAARAEARRARSYWRRIEALEADGAATPQELDDARAAMEAAEAALREATASMSYAALLSPVDGVVAARLADPGDLATPGRTILTLVRPTSLEVTADLRESVAARLAPGDPVTVRAGDEGIAYTARVARVSPSVDRASHRVRVEMVFGRGDGGSGRAPERALPPPGSYLRLELEDPSTSTLWIPADAVTRRGQLAGVYVAGQDGNLELRWLRLGERRGEAVEVLAGLEAGALVVRGPSTVLSDGVSARRVARVPWVP